MFRERAAKCDCGADFLVTQDHRGPACRECKRQVRMKARKARKVAAARRTTEASTT